MAVKLDNLTMRVMHYDEEGDAVFYLYTEGFDIGTHEILYAMHLSTAEVAGVSGISSGSSGSSGSGTYTPSYSKLDCLTCHGSDKCLHLRRKWKAKLGNKRTPGKCFVRCFAAVCPVVLLCKGIAND